jgi:hypothetical protein
MYFGADDPEAWRVSFQCFGPPISSRQTQGRQDAGGLRTEKRFHSAWPLAERYEALIRVFNDPAHYARRLAARLRAKPNRTRILLAHSANAPDLVGPEAFATLDEHARAARPPPKRDSS